MFIIVAYDISTETKAGQRRLRKVAQTCQTVGQRVQNSVFECQLDEVQYLQLVHKLQRLMHREEDNIRLYRLASISPDMILQLGHSRAVDFTAPLIL